MDINNLQRTLPQSYHVDAGRIRERIQQADKGIARGNGRVTAWIFPGKAVGF